MMRLTQSICIALSGDSVRMAAPTQASEHAVMFTVNWNWRNLQMLSYTQRPHLTAATMDTKLSSMMMTSEAFFATSVPWMPIAKPTSAFLSAGASLVPSPVTATVCATPVAIEAWMPLTRTCLSRGVERASTRRFGHTRSNSSCLMLPSASVTRSRNVLPSSTAPGPSAAVTMPHFMAIALAVSMLSPVTILTVMPAFWHCAIASGTSSRRGSSIPTRPTHTRLSSILEREISPLTAHAVCQSEGRVRWAMQRVRSPRFAKSEIVWLICVLICGVMGVSLPSSPTYLSQSAATISAAPLQ
mmetsp:Transcript_122122/g.182409  ORF Transcript_122122/g.182409 Transcript_122122/m.182409 type:complete len:300 (+) Transcript_122122:860-1759(+)